VRDPSEGNAWHADHIVPVADGGGKSLLPLKKLACVSRCTCSQLLILTMGVLLLYLRETMEDPQNWPSKMTLCIFWGSLSVNSSTNNGRGMPTGKYANTMCCVPHQCDN
jgi:hypothetical protein